MNCHLASNLSTFTNVLPPTNIPSLALFDEQNDFSFSFEQAVTGFSVGIAGNLTNITASTTTDPIPEPSTWILLGIGLAGIAVISIRKRQYLITGSDNY